MYLLLIAGLVFACFYDSVGFLLHEWGREEYSHALLLPFIVGFLIWQQKRDLALLQFTGSWFGCLLTLMGVTLGLIGELASLYVLVHYALVVIILGLALSIFGRQFFARVVVPLCFLFFAIPLPQFLYRSLSSTLQLLSSQIGVSFIRLCDISVFLEGNVIDLGAMQLQVVEACSGLRYLFPLMSLAFMCAYFYKVALWKRALVFVSSIPITVLMNSFRIGVIGVTVEYFGKEAAEGFLHDFEGWIVFMACTGILVAEMWLLARFGNDPRPLQEVFGLTFPEPLPADTPYRDRTLPIQYWVVGGLLILSFCLSLSLEHREEVSPARVGFSELPLRLGNWIGRREAMEQQYIDALKFDDYVLADYVYNPIAGSEFSAIPLISGSRMPVNFYSAYYSSQRKGESIHSPRSCIPGGGWQIASHEVVTVDGVSLYGQPMKLNRLLIQKGEDRQLVYYWFQQRGRDLTNEYVIKWYLFWDALTMNRTDGALVRLTTLAPKGEDIAAADARLQDFLKVSLPELDKYIPR
ncbi:VPLPA-CTERM-specific exosortase XrtD [Methyloterricola oryzae]|uniref:VPLPA-CTERM-specific exosortase XrtD n=1 Tax=Methyloterricola oryzae TaxID=1495050 RepID=UPI001F344FBF|nr:VPLPA-CTERM-specific exosortase XrtD [Methyloterricola oryzae]